MFRHALLSVLLSSAHATILAAILAAIFAIGATAQDAAPDLRTPDLRAPDLRALDPDLSYDARHAACLEAIADDPEAAFETAMTWVGRGGGFRARHCEAMALFTLGQEEEAGYRLDALVGEFPENAGDDVDEMRVDYSVNAAQSWLQAGETDRAWKAATRALDVDATDAPARIVRARTYFAMERVEDAELDLSNLLAYHPGHAEGLRFRADARLRLGRLDDALTDADESLTAEMNVDTALVRGHILEAIRKQTQEPAP